MSDPNTTRVLSAIEAAQKDLTRLATPAQARPTSAREAQTLLDAHQTLERAQKLLQQAQREAANIAQTAQIEGHRQGMAQAFEALTMARAEYDALMTRSEPDMVHLALELTRRIVGRHLEVEPAAMAQMVSHALTSVANQRRVEVRVHPDDLARLRPWQDDLDAHASAPVTLTEDARLEPGQCIIQTETGIIEADLDTQLQVMAEAMGVTL